MVAKTDLIRSASMRDLLEEIAAELITTNVENDEGYLSLPLLYPGGAGAVVRVRRDNDGYIVTDGGDGYREAEHLGGESAYSRIAPVIAAQHGVGFDGFSMFSTRVEREWLANTVLFTGAASKSAVDRTAERLTEERQKKAKSTFKDRITEAFGKAASFDVEIRGASLRTYKFDARIQRGDHISIFELVMPHAASVNNAFVKLHDISRLDADLTASVMLANRAKMDAGEITLLSSAAQHVIGLSDAKEVILEAA
ncbi:hypothetical protein GCM10019059_44750 [Camelimonas fluminis]|uniref:DUF1828 domain-containing protein n=1 Tax=Camelimonas fluminis TaxID=1576911 RepID=A0ABV7UAX7_9HYPH|nr:hypothetical protein [Camelimonas fluminis]GHE82054.1 hypothetical protein GCM10019059_44750 [Camelimonas fluminis]